MKSSTEKKKTKSATTRESKSVRIFKWYETDANANDAMQMCKRDQKLYVFPTHPLTYIYATVTVAAAVNVACSMFRLWNCYGHKKKKKIAEKRNILIYP